jgi:hypothetical protein
MNLMAQEKSLINIDQKKVIDFPKVELSIQDGVTYLDVKEKNSASDLLINPMSENLSYAEIISEAPNFNPNCICPITNYKIGFLMRKLMRSESEE